MSNNNNERLNTMQLAIRLAEQHNHLTVEQCERAIKIVLRGVAEGISSGERIEIRRFGSFNPTVLEPRKARNPKTGEVVFTGHIGRVQFRAGTKLKARVNNLPNNQS